MLCEAANNACIKIYCINITLKAGWRIPVLCYEHDLVTIR